MLAPNDVQICFRIIRKWLKYELKSLFTRLPTRSRARPDDSDDDEWERERWVDWWASTRGIIWCLCVLCVFFCCFTSEWVARMKSVEWRATRSVDYENYIICDEVHMLMSRHNVASTISFTVYNMWRGKDTTTQNKKRFRPPSPPQSNFPPKYQNTSRKKIAKQQLSFREAFQM